MSIDPVCGMELPTATVEATTDHEDEPYSFCSTGCRDLFENAPQQYVDTPHPHLVEVGGAILPRLPYGRARGEFDLATADPAALATRLDRGESRVASWIDRAAEKRR